MQAALDKETIDFASSLADAAGDVVRRHFRVPLTIERKTDTSPVTQVDRTVETAICDLIRKKFPEHGIFGEEHGRHNEKASHQWVIDPIDGTRAFIAGYPTFTTLISLVVDEIPVLGIIDQAITGERWLGVQGMPTLYKNRPKKIKTKSSLEQAIIATTSMDYFNEEEIQIFSYLRKNCRSAVFSGDAYAYAMLVCERIDVVVDAKLKPYDFCALKPVVEGAGGVITDWQGKSLTLHSAGHVLAAANTELYNKVRAILQPTVA